jgi:O-methyltransferase
MEDAGADEHVDTLSAYRHGENIPLYELYVMQIEAFLELLSELERGHAHVYTDHSARAHKAEVVAHLAGATSHFQHRRKRRNSSVDPQSKTAFPSFLYEHRRTINTVVAWEGHLFVEVLDGFANILLPCGSGLAEERWNAACKSVTIAMGGDERTVLRMQRFSRSWAHKQRQRAVHAHHLMGSSAILPPRMERKLPPETPEAVYLYLDLLKLCLTDSLHIERGFDDKRRVRMHRSKSPKQWVMNAMLKVLEARRMQVYYVRNENLSVQRMHVKREEGKDWPKYAETMIGAQRLSNIQQCMETILWEGIPGDMIETGVWRGGAVIFMRAVLKAYSVTDRIVYAADSFEGLPPPSYREDGGDGHHLHEELSVSLEEVKNNFDRYGMLDDQVQFLKGWFADTLPRAPIERLALLRLDGDMYGSTMDALQPLYDKVSPGGFVIVDDYALDGCRRAIGDFRKQRGITDEIVPINKASVFWRKR